MSVLKERGGRQEARRRDKDKKRKTSHEHLPICVSSSVQIRSEKQEVTCPPDCSLYFSNPANIGTFSGVPVGTTWKTNAFRGGTKITSIPPLAFLWHIHNESTCIIIQNAKGTFEDTGTIFSSL